MNAAHILLYSVFILFLFILLSNIKVRIKVSKDGTNDCVKINATALYGLLKFATNIPLVDVYKNGQFHTSAKINTRIGLIKKMITIGGDRKKVSVSDIKRFQEKYKKIHKKYVKSFEYISRKVIINKIFWISELGTGDAAITGITAGFFWMLKSNLIYFIQSRYNVDDFYIDIIPYYQEEKLKTSFDCIITLKIGYIIIAGMKYLTVKI